jgi:hypothetical protein
LFRRTRKNALFAGSDEGAENWALLASLIETCKLHGVALALFSSSSQASENRPH